MNLIDYSEVLDKNENFIYQIFINECKNKKEIIGYEEWSNFINQLKNSCLVDDNDLNNLESFWKYKIKTSGDVNNIKIGFDEMIDYVIPLYNVKEDSIVDKDVGIIEKEVFLIILYS